MPLSSPHKSPVPKFVEGVLVNREVLCEPEVRFECHARFRYHRYSFPNSALSWPRTHSRCIPMLHRVLGIRVLYIQPPADIPWPADLSSAPCFFGYWPSADRWRSKYSHALREKSMVLFRDDLKPLHPKQVEALWSFCDRLCVVITPPLLLEYILPGRLATLRRGVRLRAKHPYLCQSRELQFENLVSLIQGIWEDHCTVDNFHAFFELYRHHRLLGGDESWREVSSLHDV